MLTKIKEIFRKILPNVNMDEVNENTRLREDLDFDSLAMMMLAMELEETFGFRFEEYVRFDTVGQVCDYLEKRV